MIAAPQIKHQTHLNLAYLKKEFIQLEGENFSSEQFAEYMIWRLTRSYVEEIDIVRAVKEFNSQFVDLQLVEAEYPMKEGDGLNAGIYNLYYKFVRNK